MTSAYEHFKHQLEQHAPNNSSPVLAAVTGVEFTTSDGRRGLNFCSNDYLGLSQHPDVLAAADAALHARGLSGTGSPRTRGGTHDVHIQLERALAKFFETEDALLFSSAYAAHVSVIDALLTPADAVLGDSSNSASLRDGIRLCKAARFRYRHNDLHDLELKLQHSSQYRIRMIVTEGVFDSDGNCAALDEIAALAKKYSALLLVNDVHGVGVLGPTGRGCAEQHAILDRVDIHVGTLSSALGGTGGFVAARNEVIELLRAQAVAFTHSSATPPVWAQAGLTALRLLASDSETRGQLLNNAQYLRYKLVESGFEIKNSAHPLIILPMADFKRASALATQLYEQGFLIGCFPAPHLITGQPYLRIQANALHRTEHLDALVEELVRANKKLI